VCASGRSRRERRSRSPLGWLDPLLLDEVRELLVVVALAIPSLLGPDPFALSLGRPEEELFRRLLPLAGQGLAETLSAEAGEVVVEEAFLGQVLVVHG